MTQNHQATIDRETDPYIKVEIIQHEFRDGLIRLALHRQSIYSDSAKNPDKYEGCIEKILKLEQKVPHNEGDLKDSRLKAVYLYLDACKDISSKRKIYGENLAAYKNIYSKGESHGENLVPKIRETGVQTSKSKNGSLIYEYSIDYTYQGMSVYGCHNCYTKRTRF
jgi:hypothetical protein